MKFHKFYMETPEKPTISSDTSSDTAVGPYDAERADQERTKIKKQMFLEAFERSAGMIGVAVGYAQIDRKTYYNWIDKDPTFALRCQEIVRINCGTVEDYLIKAIHREEPWAIGMYLRSKHPEYKPKADLNLNNNTKTFEDVLQELAALQEAEQQVQQAKEVEMDEALELIEEKPHGHIEAKK